LNSSTFTRLLCGLAILLALISLVLDFSVRSRQIAGRTLAEQERQNAEREELERARETETAERARSERCIQTIRFASLNFADVDMIPERRALCSADLLGEEERERIRTRFCGGGALCEAIFDDEPSESQIALLYSQGLLLRERERETIAEERRAAERRAAFRNTVSYHSIVLIIFIY